MRQHLSACMATFSPSHRRAHRLAPTFALSSYRAFSVSSSVPTTDLSTSPLSHSSLEDSTTWHAWIYDSIPVQGMQGLLETIQYTTGFPWWASIVVSTLAFRITLLPIVRYQAHALARLAKAGPLLVALNQALSKRLDGIRPGDVKATTATCKTYAAGVNAALKVHQVGLLAAVASPLIQLPVFITFALANRRMIDTHVPGLETGGLAWFEDLTEADSLLILPALCLGSTYMNLELGFARLHESQTILRFLKDNLQLLLILGAPVSSTLPAGVFVYWFTSSIYGHAQHFALRNASVREMLGFPVIPVPGASAGAPPVGTKEEKSSLPPPLESPSSSGRGGGAALVDPRLLSQALQAIKKYEIRVAARLKQKGNNRHQEGKEGDGKKQSGGPVLSTTPPPRSKGGM